MTENMNSLCNAAAIRSLIEENKKIDLKAARRAPQFSKR